VLAVVLGAASFAHYASIARAAATMVVAGLATGAAAWFVAALNRQGTRPHGAPPDE